MRVAVIGAGPAGITAAYEIAKQNPNIDLYESSSKVGGLAKTISLWNQEVDLGPHRFFSSDTKVNKLWLEVANGDYEMVDRLTRIYYKRKFFHYPLKAFDALKNLGVLEAVYCIFSYGKEKLRPTPLDGSFENWVVNRFGRRLFNIFFKTYSEKLWGISCKELDADFAAQRIKKLSLIEAIKNALSNSKAQTKHRTLIDQFAYPTKGTGMIYERMEAFILKQGGNVFLNTPVKRVLAKNNTVYGLELEDGSIKEYDHIISSMPLTHLVKRLPEVPESIFSFAKNLTFRNTILVYLNVQAKDLFPDNWLYIHSKELEMGRLTNFRNWVPQINGQENSSILTLEYWCYDHDEFWSKSDDELIELATKEVKLTGLTADATISDGFVYRIPKCYPVYNIGYKEQLKPVEDYLKTQKNLSVIGRYGAFKYNNQDHSILMGLMAAENVLKMSGHNLWDINTDYENYQESSVITKTGLEKAITV